MIIMPVSNAGALKVITIFDIQISEAVEISISNVIVY